MKTFNLLIYKFPIENFKNSLFGDLLLKEIKLKGFKKINIFSEKEKFINIDLIIFSVMDLNLFFKYKNVKKVLYIFENIYYKINLLFIIFKIYDYFNIKKDFIMNNNFLLKIFSVNLFNFRPLNLYFVRKVSKNKNFNNFLVINNKINNKNSFYNPDMFNYYHNLNILRKNLLNLKNINKVPKKFCAFIVSNPINIDRLLFFKKLSKYKKIDSYGLIYNNLKFPKKILKKFESKPNSFCKINIELFKNYKFIICFENSYSDSHITEKLINSFLSNSIPIYKGGVDINKYFNKNSFLNVENNFENIISKIVELDNNDKKYLNTINSNKIDEDFFKNFELNFKNFCKRILN